MRRSNQQNKALHKFCTDVSDTLNESGMEMRTFLKDGISIWWTGPMVKEHIWRPIQKALLGKESTSELETNEVTKVVEVIYRLLAEKGVEVGFPSYEEMMKNYEEYEEAQR